MEQQQQQHGDSDCQISLDFFVPFHRKWVLKNTRFCIQSYLVQSFTALQYGFRISVALYLLFVLNFIITTKIKWKVN